MSIAAYLDDDRARNPDRALWLAVIQQHLTDAVSGAQSERRARDEAREWLTIPNAGFAEVCALVGLEPDHVRKRAIALIEAADRGEPISWRDKPADKAPARPAKTITHSGETLTITEWAERTGMSRRLLRSRLDAGYPPEQIFDPGTLRGRQVPRSARPAKPPRFRFVFGRATTPKIEHGGLSLTRKEWAARLGISEGTLYNRQRKGWPLERVLSPDLRPSPAPRPAPPPKAPRPERAPKPERAPRAIRRLEFNGESLTITEWAERLGIDAHTIRTRLGRGYPVEAALATDNRRDPWKRFRPAANPDRGVGQNFGQTPRDRRGEVNARAAEIGVFQ